MITKDEFYRFVDSFNGEYDELDLLNIGKKFRELPVKQRNWQELVNYLNLEKSGNAFRVWVYRNTLNMEDELKTEENAEPVSEDARFREEYKQIVKNRDILNAYRRTCRDEARIEVLQDTIKQAVSKLNELPKVSINCIGNPRGNVEAVALLSDLHIGVYCDNFVNTYNDKIAAQRLSKWTSDIIRYCDTFNVSRLNILNLGDLIHGLIHVSARLEQQYDVVNQIMVAAELVAQALNNLQVLNCEIIYRSVTDNHSRAVANLHEHIEKENFYKLIDWFLEERLKGSKIIFEHDNLDESLGLFELLNGEPFAFAHGHLESKTNVYQMFTGLTKVIPTYIALGHYHSSSARTFQGSKLFINGSVCGVEQYALSKRLASPAEQKLIIFDKTNVIDIDINLQ